MALTVTNKVCCRCRPDEGDEAGLFSKAVRKARNIGPPERAFAQKLIDAGADAYVVNGPHQLRGIEIYKGRPIFYSLGNFIYDDLRTPVGADMFDVYGKDPRVDTDAEVTVDEEAKGYPTAEGFVGSLSNPVFYESVVTVSRFERNELAELRLYPIELGHSKRFANRGVPRLAPKPQAQADLWHEDVFAPVIKPAPFSILLEKF